MADDKKKPMTPDDAARVQSHADRSGRNEDFKRRAQSGADRNEGQTPPSGKK